MLNNKKDLLTFRSNQANRPYIHMEFDRPFSNCDRNVVHREILGHESGMNFQAQQGIRLAISEDLI